VKGKYVVSTVTSELYKMKVDAITTYDEKAGCYKYWGLSGGAVAEGIIVYDLDKKIFSTYSNFNDGYVELGTGSYSDTNNWSHTLVMKNGVMFSTRDVNITPAKSATK
jgi:hypothetical protein